MLKGKDDADIFAQRQPESITVEKVFTRDVKRAMKLADRLKTVRETILMEK